MSATDGLFFNDYSEIAMTSKSIFVDWIRSWKSSKFFEENMCLSEKGREIYYHHKFFGFLHDWYLNIYS